MVVIKSDTIFEWDEKKNDSNLKKHGVSFFDAQLAFLDRHCLIADYWRAGRKIYEKEQS